MAPCRLSPEIADQSIAHGQENITLDIADPEESHVHLQQLLRQLHTKGRLTPTLVLRSLCTGYLGFFETASARCASVDQANIQALITNGDQKDAEALYKAAKLPRSVAEVVAVPSKLHANIDDPDSIKGREPFQAQLIESCRARYPDLIAGKPESLTTKLAPLLSDAC